MRESHLTPPITRRLFVTTVALSMLLAGVPASVTRALTEASRTSKALTTTEPPVAARSELVARSEVPGGARLERVEFPVDFGGSDAGGRLAAGLADPLSMAVADFDEDGMPDLACGYGIGERGAVAIFRGNPRVLFGREPWLQAPFLGPSVCELDERPVALAAGDVDDDGHADVAYSADPEGRARVLGGDGRGGLAARPTEAGANALATVRKAALEQAPASELMAAARGAYVAAVAMRLGPDAVDDLVALEPGATVPTVVETVPRATFTVTNTSLAGPGSFTQAVLDANASPGLDTIAFDILGAGPHTVTLSRPTVVDGPTVLDALTQPGSAPGKPMISFRREPFATQGGIYLSGGDSTIRGFHITPLDWDEPGIELSRAGNNIVEANFVNTSVDGGPTPSYSIEGVSVGSSSHGNRIGGTLPQQRNVLVGKDSYSLLLCSPGNVVQGNHIDVDVTGSVALDGGGLEICSSDNVIGGAAPGARNVISGGGTGIYIFSSADDANGNVVQGNFIGTDASGTRPVPNRVGISAAGANLIGGVNAGEGNLIAYNLGSAIVVTPNVNGGESRVAVLGNALFGNGRAGEQRPAVPALDLLEGSNLQGVTPNDPGDLDSGPNGLQNFPLLTRAAPDAPLGRTVVDGTLDSTPNATFRLEFFWSSACHPLGYGEGEHFLGTASVTTDGSGLGSFSAAVPGVVPTGAFVTATATNALDQTSEFSSCVVAAAFDTCATDDVTGDRFRAVFANGFYEYRIVNGAGADDNRVFYGTANVVRQTAFARWLRDTDDPAKTLDASFSLFSGTARAQLVESATGRTYTIFDDDFRDSTCQ